MTQYNVVEDRAEWARVKVSLMPPKDRRHLMKELISRDEAYAFDVMGQLVASGHSVRVLRRKHFTYP